MATNVQHARMPVAVVYSTPDQAEEMADRKRFLYIILFVSAFTFVSLAVYLLLRPHNRHLELTPYENLISQLRSGMSEPDVVALFKNSIENGVPAEIATYDKLDSSGSRHVVAYRLRGDEPLEARFAAGGGGRIAEWCYRDHCHDNIY